MTLSPRLRTALDELPLRPGLRVLEIGCGPGALARAAAHRIAPGGHLLGLDRSDRAIAQAASACAAEIAAGLMSLRRGAIEDFALAPGEPPFDLAFALRVGALDGRHPAAGRQALACIRAALAPGGRLFTDAAGALAETPLPG